MTRSKALAIAFVVLLLFTNSCASGGIKRPIIYADQPNNIPADIPSQFLDRYYFLIVLGINKVVSGLLTDGLSIRTTPLYIVAFSLSTVL